MKFECIAHPPATQESGYFYTMLRREYWEICEPCEKEVSAIVRACAAKLLNHFEQWMNSKLAAASQSGYVRSISTLGGHPDDHDDDLWVFGQSSESLTKVLMEYKPKTIRQALNWLAENGYLYRRTSPKNTLDKCYQYQINVALVQWKINQLIVRDEQKSAETQAQSISPTDASSVSETNTIDLPIRSKNLEIKEKETNGQSFTLSDAHDRFEKNDLPCGENPGLSNHGKEDRKSDPIEPKQKDLSSLPRANTDPLTTLVNPLEEESIAPRLFSKQEIINGRLWFYDFDGRVVLPEGDCYKLARACTNRSLQFWLVDRMVEDDWRIAVTPSNDVWVYDPLEDGAEWMFVGDRFNKSEFHGLAKLTSIAEHLDVFDLDDYNDAAIELFERFVAGIKAVKAKITKVTAKNILEVAGIEFEAVEWEDPGDEEWEDDDVA